MTVFLFDMATPKTNIYSNWVVNNWVSTVSTTSFEDSVYGKRDGVITGLAITHRDGKNLFHNSRGWKSGTIHGITMLPRGDMWKPDAKETCSLITIFICFVFFHSGGCFHRGLGLGPCHFIPLPNVSVPV